MGQRANNAGTTTTSNDWFLSEVQRGGSVRALLTMPPRASSDWYALVGTSSSQGCSAVVEGVWESISHAVLCQCCLCVAYFHMPRCVHVCVVSVSPLCLRRGVAWRDAPMTHRLQLTRDEFKTWWLGQSISNQDSNDVLHVVPKIAI